MARNYVIFKQRSYSKEECAKAMLRELHAAGITKTPDGAPYSVSSIKAAMVRM
jgi:hypothetical protein